MSTSSTFLKQFYIPNYILNLDSQPETLSDAPECPVVVFINSKSGGQLGGNLLVTYRSLLNENQVNSCRGLFSQSVHLNFECKPLFLYLDLSKILLILHQSMSQISL